MGSVEVRIAHCALAAIVALVGCGGPPRVLSPEDQKAAARQADSAKEAGESVVQTNGIGMELVWIPPGEFRMGGPTNEKRERAGDGPVPVTISRAFRMSKTEVTRGQWHEVVGTEPWKSGMFDDARMGATCPVLAVPWDDAVAFCEKLSERERRTGKLTDEEVYRLPTEAEWEYASRADGDAYWCCGNDAQRLPEFAWYHGSRSAKESYAHPVGGKLPNAWGLHDMHGNAYEWCFDRFERRLPGGIDPTGPSRGGNRVIRGGCWVGEARDCSSYAREESEPAGSVVDLVGFRVVRSRIR